MWKLLDEEGKEPYKSEAKRLKQQFEIDRPELCELSKRKQELATQAEGERQTKRQQEEVAKQAEEERQRKRQQEEVAKQAEEEQKRKGQQEESAMQTEVEQKRKGQQKGALLTGFSKQGCEQIWGMKRIFFITPDDGSADVCVHQHSFNEALPTRVMPGDCFGWSSVKPPHLRHKWGIAQEVRLLPPQVAKHAEELRKRKRQQEEVAKRAEEQQQKKQKSPKPDSPPSVGYGVGCERKKCNRCKCVFLSARFSASEWNKTDTERDFASRMCLDCVTQLQEERTRKLLMKPQGVHLQPAAPHHCQRPLPPSNVYHASRRCPSPPLQQLPPASGHSATSLPQHSQREGWQRLVDSNQRVYYLDHHTKTSSWTLPAGRSSWSLPQQFRPNCHTQPPNQFAQSGSSIQLGPNNYQQAPRHDQWHQHHDATLDGANAALERQMHLGARWLSSQFPQ